MCASTMATCNKMRVYKAEDVQTDVVLNRARPQKTLMEKKKKDAGQGENS